MSSLRDDVQHVLRDIFHDPDLVLRDEMDTGDFDNWDSLQHINIIIAIEQKLNIRFTMLEISRLRQPDQNIGTFMQMLERKVAGH